MKVWILQTGEPLQIDNSGLRPMRAINLSTALIERGHEVTLWSSDFDHFSKSHRFSSAKELKLSESLTIRLVKSRGYKSHIGLSRLVDHGQLGWNLRKCLRKETPPDVAFIGYPPIEPAWVMARWLKKRATPFVLDVKDAWPSLLVEAFPKMAQFIVRILLHPYFIMMRSTFTKANSLSSISQDFLDWALEISKIPKESPNMVVPLTSNELIFSDSDVRDAAKWWDRIGIVNSEILTVYFIGSLTESFDFMPLIEVANALPIRLVIAGDGPKRTELLEISKGYPNIILPGWISAVQSKVLAGRSHVAVAPVTQRMDFNMSIPNKFYDAMQHGVPMLTSIKGPAAEMLITHDIGMLYEGDTASLKLVLERLLEYPALMIQMSSNARKLYEEKYRSVNVYGKLVQDLENLVL